MSTAKQCYVQVLEDTSCTYEIRAIFSDKIFLAEVLAERVLRDRNSPKKEETA
jgi:hypothetical protein